MAQPEIEQETNAEYAFIIRIPSYGKPSRRSADLLDTLRKHISVSVSSVAIVEPYVEPKKPAKKVTKKVVKKTRK